MAVPDITVPDFFVTIIDGGGYPTNIYHGRFWPTDADLGPFHWECWCRPGAGAEYWISEGFGGAHALLAGFNGSGGPTGNVYNGVGNTSFTGAYTAQVGEWLHYAVQWDGTDIWVLINGIVCGVFPFAGPRRAQYGDLFIAGSDHSNFVGSIAQVRAWEGQVPVGAPYYGFQFPVERYFTDRMSTQGALSQFCTNYLAPVDTYPDISDGFCGQHHPGASRGLYNGFYSDVGPQVHPPRIVDPTAPFGNQKDVARTRTFQAPVAVPSGAKIWDSFGRADSISAFSAQPMMGSTEGGSLGVKVWEHEQSRFGIFDGAAVCGVNSAYTRVPNDSADMDVRVGRLNDAAKGIFSCSAAARLAADRSSAWVASTFKNYVGVVYVGLNRPDGSVAGNWVADGTWTRLRLSTIGTTVTVYIDDGASGWTQLGQFTGETQNQAEVGAGIFGAFGVGTQARYTSFEVR